MMTEDSVEVIRFSALSYSRVSFEDITLFRSSSASIGRVPWALFVRQGAQLTFISTVQAELKKLDCEQSTALCTANSTPSPETILRSENAPLSSKLMLCQCCTLSGNLSTYGLTSSMLLTLMVELDRECERREDGCCRGGADARWLDLAIDRGCRRREAVSYEIATNTIYAAVE